MIFLNWKGIVDVVIDDFIYQTRHRSWTFYNKRLALIFDDFLYETIIVDDFPTGLFNTKGALLVIFLYEEFIVHDFSIRKVRHWRFSIGKGHRWWFFCTKTHRWWHLFKKISFLMWLVFLYEKLIVDDSIYI